MLALFTLLALALPAPPGLPPPTPKRPHLEHCLPARCAELFAAHALAISLRNGTPARAAVHWTP
jgi:hypothetical protein